MSESEAKFETRILAEIIVFAALSATLYTLRPFSLPYGGSVTLGSMVPVMWLSLRRGVRVGLVAGAIFGLAALPIDVILLPYSPIANPVQVFLEYPIAFGIIGLTGVFRNRSALIAVGGAALSVFIRFWIHYFVGVFVWSAVYEFPPEYGLWLWPAIYNGSFLAVEFIVSAVLLYALVKKGTLNYRF